MTSMVWPCKYRTPVGSASYRRFWDWDRHTIFPKGAGPSWESTSWNNSPTNDTVTLIMTQVGDDGAFPYLYLINTLASGAVVE